MRIRSKRRVKKYGKIRSKGKLLNKRELGTQKELLAMHYLEKQGMKILERNFRCRTGEIDLIARVLFLWRSNTVRQIVTVLR